jgi:hypothetical protein
MTGQAVPFSILQGKIVPPGQLLNTLGKSYETAGASVRLNILVDQALTLSEVFSAQATVGKVGFTNSKVFCFDHNRQAMWEIVLGPERTFSAKP